METNKDRQVLLRIDNLRQYFNVKSTGFRAKNEYVRANDGITLDIYEGETFGLVGESGCGKSTLGRSLLQLYEQTAGRTIYFGKRIHDIDPDYVMDILNNIPKERNKLKDLDADRKSKLEILEAIDKEDTDSRQYALDDFNRVDDAYNHAELTLINLIGGLYLVEGKDDEISKYVVNEYKAKVAYNKEIREGKNPSRDKLDKAEKELESFKDQFRDIEGFEEKESQISDGIDLTKLNNEEMRRFRNDLQLIFQDPYSSLNPRMTVGQIISEGLYAHNMYKSNSDELQDYVTDVMEMCGLASYFLHRYPHQFSGGQRQRIGIARSVALKPTFMVCDEAVSALDVSIQSQIINLLLDLKERENLTYLFISHDLSVIKYISDRVGVMYLGNLVELADTEEIYARPMHPYTEALMSAIPTTDEDRGELIALEGDIPSPIKPPLGCKFHTRCKYATDICRHVEPVWEEVNPGHFVACHHKLHQND